eukprot:1108939-Amphidinium_carterae.1
MVAAAQLFKYWSQASTGTVLRLVAAWCATCILCFTTYLSAMFDQFASTALGTQREVCFMLMAPASNQFHPSMPDARAVGTSMQTPRSSECFLKWFSDIHKLLTPPSARSARKLQD